MAYNSIFITIVYSLGVEGIKKGYPFQPKIRKEGNKIAF